MRWKITTLIFRLKTNAEGVVVPGIEWLCRHEDALFEQDEWYWRADIDSAFKFEDTEPADRHLAKLKDAGEQHAHTYIFGREAQQAQQERQRERRQSIAPSQSYEDLERRGLA